MLDIHRLNLLRELSIRGTIAEVAASLSYSPSSVSQQLALLEREAGVELLRKAGRRLQLTQQGQLLVEHTAELLDCLERAEAAIAASHVAVTGTVRLAVFQTAVLALMPQALQLMRQRHPSVRVEMVQHEPETALRETWAREFDLVIAEQYPGHAAPHYEGLDRQHLTGDAIRLALPLRDGGGDANPRVGTESLELTGPTDFDAVDALEDARALPWVMEPVGAASRHWAEQACRRAGFEPDVRYETADLQAHVRLVESGNAAAFLPDLVWVGREPHARLITLDGDPRRTIFTAIRSASTRRPAIMAIRTALEETVHLLAKLW